MRFLNPPLSTLLCVLAALCSYSSDASAAQPRKPNVVVIMADDLGYADLAHLKQAPDDVKRFGTPNLDRLAASGVSFADAYATSPICSPSRSGFITGSYQQRWGNFWYGGRALRDDAMTLPRVLKKHGYRTVKLGKTHLGRGGPQHPLDHGFDEFLGFMHHTWDYTRLSEKDRAAYKQRSGGKGLGLLNAGPLTKGRDEAVSIEDGYTTKVFTDRAIEIIEDQDDKRPFYIQLEHNAVHMPTYVTDPKWAAKVGLDVPAWNRDSPETWKFPYWDPQAISWSEWHRDWGHLEEIDPDGRKRYLSHLIAMDHHIGRIIDALEASGERENTIIVFLSDNGGTINTYSNNAPLRGWKYMFGEGGIRVPMTIVYPGHVEAGKRRAGLVSAMDVMPTVIELVGGESPEGLDGRSLVGILAGKKTGDNHTHLCWARGSGKAATRVIRKGKWKLAINAEWEHANFKMVDGKAERDPQPATYPGGIALFDLSVDIGEKNNVADQHPKIVAELTELLDQWLAEMKSK